MEVHAGNPSTQKAEAGGYCEFEAMYQVPGQPGLYGMTLTHTETKLKPFLFMIKHKQELMKTIAILHMILSLRSFLKNTTGL